MREQRDFEQRFLEAERIKQAMRRRYAEAVRAIRNEPYAQALDRARNFWGEYELVNRRLIPEDPVYYATRGAAALSTSADFWTLTSSATGQVRLLESALFGEATASAVVRFAVQRSTGGATPTNQTPEKANTRSPAAASTFATAWTTQPTLAGTPLFWHTFNAFGGSDREVPTPGAEIYLVDGEQLSGRSASGTSTCTGFICFEEL